MPQSVLDSIGEFETFTIWHGHNNSPKKSLSRDIPQHSGLFYSAMTQRVRLKANAEEHKFEQLAKKGYWRKNYRLFMEELVDKRFYLKHILISEVAIGGDPN